MLQPILNLFQTRRFHHFLCYSSFSSLFLLFSLPFFISLEFSTRPTNSRQAHTHTFSDTEPARRRVPIGCASARSFNLYILRFETKILKQLCWSSDFKTTILKQPFLNNPLKPPPFEITLRIFSRVLPTLFSYLTLHSVVAATKCEEEFREWIQQLKKCEKL